MIQVSLLKQILKERKYFFGFTALTFAFFALFVGFAAYTMPGNDFLFQLSLYNSYELFLLALLSVLVSLNFIVQIYRYAKIKKASIAAPLASTSAGLLASLFGTVACINCLAPWLVLVGLSSWIILIQYRFWITLGAVLLTMGSLYLSLNSCHSCIAPKKRK